jgi:hypothetical protein
VIFDGTSKGLNELYESSVPRQLLYELGQNWKGLNCVANYEKFAYLKIN